jgi:hypothetical protein
MKKFSQLTDAVNDLRLGEIGYGGLDTWKDGPCARYLKMQLQTDCDEGNYIEYSIIRLDDAIDGAEFYFEMTEGRQLTDEERDAWYDWALACPVKAFKLERPDTL